MLKVTLRGIFSHKFRLVLTAFAVIVSVAFMAGTLVLTATISSSFDKVFDDVYKNIDVVVRSPNEVDTGFGKIRAPIGDDVVPTVKGVAGVAAVEGQVQAQVAILDKNGEATSDPNSGPPTFGLNWLTEPTLNGWHIDQGRAPRTPSEVLLDHQSASSAGYQVGDPVKIQVNKGVREFTVVGTGGFGTTDSYAGAPAVVFDTATAQDLLLEPGKFSWINVAGESGISQAELQSRVGSAVKPEQAQAITGTAFTAESQDVFRTFLNIVGTILFAFGAIALFVGAFIIYNTFSIIVAQRTRELALLRAIGAGRLQVLGSVTIEAFVVGAVASLLGLLGGIGLAAGLTKLLGSGGNGPPIDGLTYPPGGFIFAFVIGTTVTVLSGLFPAWKASRVPPVAAMRDVAVDTTGRSPVRLVFGVVTMLVGALLAYLGLFTSGDNNAAKVGLAFAAIFIGVIILGPLFAEPLSRLIGAPMFTFNGRLARSNAMRNPRRTAATASALMIGVGLVVVSAVLAQSIKASLNSAIDQAFSVDLIVDSGSFGQTGLDPSLGRHINDVDGVQSATGIEFGFAKAGGEATTVLGADLAGLTKVIHIDVDSGDLAGLTPSQVAVSRSNAKSQGWTVGTPIKATFVQGGEQEVTVGAIYNLQGQLGSGMLMSTEGFGQRFPAAQQVFNQIFVKLEPDANASAARDQITQLVRTDFPTAKVQDLTQYKNSQTGVFDILLSIITVMLVIAIFIAVLGIVNTLLLSVYERTREIGLLRAVGMGRRQVRQVVRRESVIFSLQGTVIGTVIGFVCSWAIVRAIGEDNAVSFAVPWVLLIVMVIIAMIAGVVAAVIPAYSASRLNVLDAIATD